MKLKSTSLNRIIKQILPSVFFIVLIAGSGVGSKIVSVYLITGSIVLVLFVNIFLQNIIIRMILGFIFILCSLYMMLALLDDIVDGRATFSGGYWIGFVIVIFSLAMSILLVMGYEKKKQLSEAA